MLWGVSYHNLSNLISKRMHDKCDVRNNRIKLLKDTKKPIKCHETLSKVITKVKGVNFTHAVGEPLYNCRHPIVR